MRRRVEGVPTPSPSPPRVPGVRYACPGDPVNRPPQLIPKDINVIYAAQAKAATQIANDDVIGQYTSGAEVYSQVFKEKDEVIGFLKKVNNELDGTPFKIAYRVRDEFLIYCFYASKNPTANWLINALDEMTSMKILSRIEGDETKTGKVLMNLQRILTADFKRSNAKLKEMETRLQSNGYTSFWS